jgi:hypothetical protein
MSNRVEISSTGMHFIVVCMKLSIVIKLACLSYMRLFNNNNSEKYYT